MHHWIDLVIVGDDWFNQDEVAEKLTGIPITDSVVFSTKHEGVSLAECGFLDWIKHELHHAGRHLDTVLINTPNQIELLPFEFYQTIKLSHFFTAEMLNYHRDPAAIDVTARLFGLFVGRYTADRNMMVRDMLPYRDQMLISVLHNDQTDLNNPCTVTYDRDIWDIGSIDSMSISDQFQGIKNTNLSLLGFYDRFQIEIVAETMTRGCTFFPTEKTVRPIIGSKPMIVFGPKNFLANLACLGFRTFGEIWDEDYDQYQGSQRWERMKQTVQSVIQDGYNIDLAQEIVYHNYSVLQEISKDG